MNDKKLNPNEREKLAWCYHRALEAGDFETISSVLLLAETDHILEKLILEVNETRLSTLQGGADTEISNNPFEKERKMQLRLRNPIETSWLTTLTVSLIVLLVGALLFFGGQPDNSVIHLSSNGLPVLEQDTVEPQSQESINIALVQDMIEQVVKAPATLDVLNGFFPETVAYHPAFNENVFSLTPNDVGRAFAALRQCATLGTCELNITIEQISAVDDQVMVQYTYDYSSENYIEITGIRLGKSARLEAAWVFRIEDSKIVEVWDYWHSDPFWEKYYQDQVQAEYEAELETERDEILTIGQRYFDEILSNNDPSALETAQELYASFAMYHMPICPDELGPGAITATAAYDLIVSWYEAMPDLVFTLDSLMVDGDYVILQYSYTGHLTNAFEVSGLAELPANGQQIDAQHIMIFRIEDQKIAEQWWYVDDPLFTFSKAIGDYCPEPDNEFWQATIGQ